MRVFVSLFVSISFAAGQSQGDGCKEPAVYNEENGVIYSPYYGYYPDYTYPPNFRCRYIINVPERKNISVRFLLPFDTEESILPGTCWDPVLFYTSNRTGREYCLQTFPDVVAGPYCGRNNDTFWSFVVGTSSLTIEFCSDATGGRGGFGLVFNATDQPEKNLTAVTAPPVTIASTAFPTSSTNVCGGTIILTDSNNETIIESPGYPISYAVNLNCIWSVEATAGSTLSIKANGTFSIEKSDGCRFDALIINDVIVNTTLGTFCGTTGPDVTSRGNQVEIRFRSDGSVERAGFTLRIREPKCSAEYSRCPNDPKGDECAFRPAMLCDGKEDCPNGLDENCPHGCGISEARPLLSTVGRIVGGIEARPHSWPWQVALIDGPTEQISCGGAVIDRYFVLTAAHCCAALNTEELKIRVGEHSAKWSREPNAVDYEVRRATIHPDYWDTPVPVNDFCLLETKLPILYSKDVTPICLPSSLDAPDGKACFLSGWGEVDQYDRPKNGNTSVDYTRKDSIIEEKFAASKATSDVLRQVDVRIFNHEECNKQYNYVLTTAMICAVNPDRDSCQGDSGGPLQCPSADDPNRYEVVGVVSFGYGCADHRFAGVNARVSQALDWITDTILEHEPTW